MLKSEEISIHYIFNYFRVVGIKDKTLLYHHKINIYLETFVYLYFKNNS